MPAGAPVCDGLIELFKSCVELVVVGIPVDEVVGDILDGLRWKGVSVLVELLGMEVEVKGEAVGAYINAGNIELWRENFNGAQKYGKQALEVDPESQARMGRWQLAHSHCLNMQAGATAKSRRPMDPHFFQCWRACNWTLVLPQRKPDARRSTIEPIFAIDSRLCNHDGHWAMVHGSEPE